MTNKLKRNKKYTVIKKTIKNMYNQIPEKYAKLTTWKRNNKKKWNKNNDMFYYKMQSFS